MDYNIERDRAAFFDNIRSATTSQQLLSGFIRYDGIIYDDQRQHLRLKFNTLRETEGRPAFEGQLLDFEDGIDPQLLAKDYAELGRLYFPLSSSSNWMQWNVIPASPNQYRDVALPTPPNLRMMRTMRAGLNVSCSPAGGCLFVSPHGYQYVSDDGSVFSDMRSRSFSRTISIRKRQEIRNSLVVIQDNCDGGNFAHFLFDWMPRLVHFLNSNIKRPSDCTFILGGVFGDFQKAILGEVIQQYGLRLQNFLVPSSKLILETAHPIYFFSDQKEAPLHPAHMAHPKSLSVVTKLIGGLSNESGSISRIFVSRKDAKLRRIANEDALVEMMSAFGFKSVNLSQYSIKDQVSLIKGAEIIVGAHGMGLTHIAAHVGRLKVVELFHPAVGSDAYIFISRALGFEHRSIIGIEEPDEKSSYLIDPEELHSCITELVE